MLCDQLVFQAGCHLQPVVCWLPGYVASRYEQQVEHCLFLACVCACVVVCVPLQLPCLLQALPVAGSWHDPRARTDLSLHLCVTRCMDADKCPRMGSCTAGRSGGLFYGFWQWSHHMAGKLEWLVVACSETSFSQHPYVWQAVGS